MLKLLVRRARGLAAAMLCVGFVSGGARAAEIAGAGSTFVYPIMVKWAADYTAKTGDKVNYQSIGSGGGIAQIEAGTVDFGTSDKPLSPEQLEQAGLAQFPIVIGGVVPVVNFPGALSGDIKFTGKLLGDIFRGVIKEWNDSAIKEVNPSVKLPWADITVVHRSDESGTTFNLSDYLSKVNADWRARIGEGMSVAWPFGVDMRGNEGVGSYVGQHPYSIGYVEYAYVRKFALTYGSVQNQSGKFVVPSEKSFQAAAASVDWAHAKDFSVVMTDARGDDAYPITAAVFITMHKQPKDAARSKAALAFFKWALESGQQQAHDLDYVSLPPEVVKQIEDYWAANIKVQ